MSRLSKLVGTPALRNLDAQKIIAMRRAFLASAGLAGAAVVGSGLLGGRRAEGAGATYADPNPNGKDVNHHANANDILNFALNLEYLEAEFYLRATTGVGLTSADTSGVVSKGPGKEPKTAGTAGTVTGGSQVNFQVPVIQQLANDITADEVAHVRLLRTALGKNAVAEPNINLSTSFTAAAIAAGVITAGMTFDPFANDDNFLLGAFVFEDVGVTAYHGAAPYVGAKILPTAAGILGTEAYHAGAIRAMLISRGQTMATDISIANAISTLRAGADKAAGGPGDDAPVTDSSGNGVFAANDANGLVYARTFDEVLAIVYLGGPIGTGGGFFPNGMNGAIV
ncbi:MAG TPA: ferritin-like domain-containing protein [Tepidisphaeraceae bacterium]|nr:ferritin-like domain-containing protein [Tepidisphaeraceae bacterium]